MTIWLLFALSFFPLMAIDKASLSIESGMVDYNGNRIRLYEEVSIRHPLGILSAEEIELIPEKSFKDQFQFRELEMKKRVHLQLQDGGELSCHTATINQGGMKGHFLSGEDSPFVVYKEPYMIDGIPIKVRSRQMELTLTGKKGEKIEDRIDAIEAKEEVSVVYGEYTAMADQALYRRPQDKGKEGKIVLMANEGKLCQMINAQGDIIKASRIEIDATPRQLLLTFPVGRIKIKEKKYQQIDFSANSLEWDHLQHILTLKDNVLIQQAGMGSISTEDELHIFQEKINNSYQIQFIEARGKTAFTYTDGNHLEHKLTCYGKVRVDHKALKTTLDSPRDLQGHVFIGKQVHFYDQMGEIYADKITIFYQINRDLLSPSHIVLEGNIRMMKSAQVDPEEVRSHSQYGIADKAEYDPEAKEITLSSRKPKRVLLIDEINHLQISAAVLKVRRDRETNQESIQGVGDVRFHFMQQEVEEFKKIYPLSGVLQ